MVRSSDNFRMADGAEIVEIDDDSVKMRITIPMDPEGFLGRQCPDCSQIFRIDFDGYDALALSGDAELWCVYCGHHVEHGDFLTEQQRDRVMRAIGDVSTQLVGHAFDGVFRHQSPQPGGGIEIRFRSHPFYPQPLPNIDEERLVRIRQCASCALRYAIFGEHRFCPGCGPLPADVVALDALTAETVRLDALAQLPSESLAALREQGVFDRIWVDTLENLVGLVETLAGAVFHAAVSDAPLRIKGKGNVFQRLDDTAELFVAAGHDDLRGILDASTWARLQQVWATRHVFTHNDGMVDAKYLTKVPGTTAHIGRRLNISEQLCRQAIIDSRTLCLAVSALTT